MLQRRGQHEQHAVQDRPRARRNGHLHAEVAQRHDRDETVRSELRHGIRPPLRGSGKSGGQRHGQRPAQIRRLPGQNDRAGDHAGQAVGSEPLSSAPPHGPGRRPRLARRRMEDRSAVELERLGRARALSDRRRRLSHRCAGGPWNSDRFGCALPSAGPIPSPLGPPRTRLQVLPRPCPTSGRSLAPPQALIATYFVSRYSPMPSKPPSRPNPDCLTPPKGGAGLETAPWLRPTIPLSSPSHTRNARDRSRVYTYATSPYSVRLAAWSASASEEKVAIGATGPKISSRRSRASCGTASRTVGAKK